MENVLLTNNNLMKTGIALSGGGVRATVFHLGVLARLAETEIWNSLEHISTVSGGSLCVALIFEKAGKKWPGAEVYLRQCLPSIYKILTSYNLQWSYTWRAFFHLLEGRAHIVGKLIKKHWGITSCISEIPETNPRWTISATCYETGKNWRFHKKRMGDYIANYVVTPAFPLSDAVAASAAVPGLIGPLKISTSHYSWKKYTFDDKPDADVPPIAKTLTLWDGGVYDNLGVEAIYKTKEGLRYDLDFALISDASKPLGFLQRNWLGNFVIPHLRLSNKTRLIDIPSDQVRGLRARELFSFFRVNNKGGYLRMGESVARICKNLEVPVPDALFMPDSVVKEVASLETTLRKLTPDEFKNLFRHGYEVCSAVLYGINNKPFSEFNQGNYSWMP